MNTIIQKKWNTRYSNSEKIGMLQEIYTEPGTRNCIGENDRYTFSIINQLISGKTKLKDHWSKIMNNDDNLCDTCQVPETVNHYIYECAKFVEDRDIPERSVEEILNGLQITCGDLSLSVLVGEIDGIGDEGRSKLIGAMSQYLTRTKRL